MGPVIPSSFRGPHALCLPTALSGCIWHSMGKQWKQCQTLYLGAPKSLQMVIAAMKLKDAYSLEGKL